MNVNEYLKFEATNLTKIFKYFQIVFIYKPEVQVNIKIFILKVKILKFKKKEYNFATFQKNKITKVKILIKKLKKL